MGTGKTNRPVLEEAKLHRSEGEMPTGLTLQGGLDHNDNGTNLQMLNLGLQAGYNQDKGSLSAHGHGTLAAIQHDPVQADYDLDTSPNSGFWGGMHVLDASAGAKVQNSRSGYQAEAGFHSDIIAGEVGYREISDESKSDRGFRAGLSAGIGSATGRAYLQDADHDDRTEYGMGVSIPLAGLGGASLDYTTETPFGDLATLFMPAIGPAGNALIEAMGNQEHSPASRAQDLWDNAPWWASPVQEQERNSPVFPGIPTSKSDESLGPLGVPQDFPQQLEVPPFLAIEPEAFTCETESLTADIEPEPPSCPCDFEVLPVEFEARACELEPEPPQICEEGEEFQTLSLHTNNNENSLEHGDQEQYPVCSTTEN